MGSKNLYMWGLNIGAIIYTILVLTKLVNIPELQFVASISKVLTLVVYLVTWLIITVICGKRHAALDGEKITIASVLKEKERTKTKHEQNIERIKDALQFCLVIITGLSLNSTITILLWILSLLLIGIAEINKNVKMADAFYTLNMICVVQSVSLFF